MTDNRLGREALDPGLYVLARRAIGVGGADDRTANAFSIAVDFRTKEEAKAFAQLIAVAMFSGDRAQGKADAPEPLGEEVIGAADQRSVP